MREMKYEKILKELSGTLKELLSITVVQNHMQVGVSDVSTISSDHFCQPQFWPCCFGCSLLPLIKASDLQSILGKFIVHVPMLSSSIIWFCDKCWEGIGSE